MELFVLGLAFICMLIGMYYIALPIVLDLINKDIKRMNHNMQVLEYSIINLKKQLHTVTDKYNELSVILEKKYTEMPSVLKSHADEMQQDFDQQLKKYNEQMHHDQLELLKKQNDDALKNYILNALQEKLTSRLKSKNINHSEILNKIIVDYKKTAQ